MSRKRSIVFVVVYITALIGISAVSVASGQPNYFNYKSFVRTAQENDDKKLKIKENEDKEAKNIDKEKEETDSTNNKTATTTNTNNNTTTTTNNNTTTNVTVAPQTSSSTNTPIQTVENNYETVNFDRDLSFGAKGDDVKKLQYLLKKKNIYTGDITGEYDKATKDAVYNFQKTISVNADGIVGKNTREKLLGI